MPTTTDEQPTDADLLDEVRAGNLLAYGALCQRHAEPAQRLAHRLLGEHTAAQELTADALGHVLRALRRGDGPRWNLRPHLLDTIRRLAAGHPGDTIAPPPEEITVRRWHSQLADPAFQRLPPRWQLVLWHLEAGPTGAEDLAAVLGTSPGGVAALIRRARDDLRGPDPDCRSVHHQLRTWLDGTLPHRHLDEHIAGCATCLSTSLQLLGTVRRT